MLNRGESPLKGEEPGLEALIKKVVDAGKFRCTSDFSKIGELDAVTLAIQTPFKDPKDLVPDFGALIEGLKMAGRHMSPGALVVLESTITPGTTLGMARDILELESGLKAGEDFALAHAPERVMVGRLLRNIQEHDRIVGGIDEISTRRAVELYQPVLTKGEHHPHVGHRCRGDQDGGEHVPGSADRGGQRAGAVLRGHGHQLLRCPRRASTASKARASPAPSCGPGPA